MTANDSTPSVALLAIVVLGLGAAGFGFYYRARSTPTALVPAAPAVLPTPPTEPTDVLPAAAGNLEILTPAQAGVPLENCIAYPDGTRLPPLNGVEQAPRIAFHRRLPFTKVIGRQTDSSGVEWYVHENGAWSTTRYQLRNGVREAIGETMMPVAPVGVVDK